MTELEKLSGFGPATVEKYQAAGFQTVEDIARSSSQELLEKVGLNIAKGQKLIGQAQRVSRQEAIIIETAAQVKEFRDTVIKRISTGSSRFDFILGGGVQTDGSTLFAGEFGTGKTQICNQLIVNCVADYERKGVFIETEPSCFSPNRLLEMSLKGRQDKPNIKLDEDVFAIRSEYVSNTDKQFKAYQQIESELIIGKEIDVGIIVIDSFTAHFRTQFLGRESLIDRGKELARHIGYLQELASKYNLAIVCTGQVGGNPLSAMEGGAKPQRRTGISHNIYGGDMFQHSFTHQISLEQTKGGRSDSSVDEWTAYIYDSPDRPRMKCEFKLCAEGIRDL